MNYWKTSVRSFRRRKSNNLSYKIKPILFFYQRLLLLLFFIIIIVFFSSANMFVFTIDKECLSGILRPDIEEERERNWNFVCIVWYGFNLIECIRNENWFHHPLNMFVICIRNESMLIHSRVFFLFHWISLDKNHSSSRKKKCTDC